MKYKCVADADVAIHCGDLTEESKLHEFKTALQTLRSIRAPLKLVIAGNHDFTLDVPAFKRKLSAIDPPLDDALVKREYGTFGEARALLESEEAKAAGARTGPTSHRKVKAKQARVLAAMCASCS